MHFRSGAEGWNNNRHLLNISKYLLAYLPSELTVAAWCMLSCSVDTLAYISATLNLPLQSRTETETLWRGSFFGDVEF